MANRTQNRPKPPRRLGDGQKSAPPHGPTDKSHPTPRLSTADIAELAQQMQIPDGMLQMVLDRYPELGKPLVRRWTLATRDTAA